MYDKVSPNLNFVEREKKTEKFWEDNHIFQKSIDERKEGEVYTFYDGPPTANGKPHIGHVLTRVIKDMIPRYRTMKGYKVLRKAGWDTHGLPVELEVEKKLGLDGTFTFENWRIWCNELFQNANIDPDSNNEFIWYSGEKSYLSKISTFYPNHKFELLNRADIAVSGTSIRNDPEKNKEFIHPIFREYLYRKNILKEVES